MVVAAVDEPLVSVIVPNYNHAKFLKQRLESILTQTFTNFELIIIDDCSTDDSMSVINSFSDKRILHVIRNTTNSGSAFAQWKKGMELCNGKYVWIAESDDYCSEDFLANAVSSLDAGSELFYCQSIVVDEDGMEVNTKVTWFDDISPTRWKSSFTSSANTEVAEILSLKNTIPNASAVVFKRSQHILEYFENVQGMRYCGDWIFWMQFLLGAKSLAYSVNTTNYFRVHSGVTRRNTNHVERNKEIARVLVFIAKFCNPSHPIEKLARYFCRIHFTQYKGVTSLQNFLLTIRLMMVSKHFWSEWRSVA